MKIKEKNDIFKLLKLFELTYRNRPSSAKMYTEIQMMKFKIKPIQGQISDLDMKNDKFIEALWSIGKMEEIFEKNYLKISIKNREAALRAFTHLYKQFQEKMNRVDLKSENPGKNELNFEIEIFKEINSKAN